MERLKHPESRRMAQPLASVGAFEGFEGFEAFEGQFRATRKKDLARQSPEPTACATPPTVSQSPEPTVWQVRGFGASEASRIQRLAAPARQRPEPTACATPPTVSQSPDEPTACATPPTVSQSPEPTVWQVRGFGASDSRRAQRPQSSKCEVLERLKHPWSV